MSSLAALAFRMEFFERTQPFQGRSAIRLSDRLARAGGLTFDKIDVTTTVRNHILQNVVLDGDSLILFKDGQAKFGLHILLWVMQAGDPHRVGTIETLAPD